MEIVGYSEHWADAFASLNYEWIEKYFAVERHDREILGDPEKYVIKLGGQIFMAIMEGQAVGTVALIPASQEVLELTKMAVLPKFQGRGIGDVLMSASVKFARDQNYSMIFLESHHKLAPALSLYRKHGFVDVARDPNSLYSRADVRMELAINGDNM